MESNKLFIWSLRRSGAHGIIEWLKPLYGNKLKLFNNSKTDSPKGMSGEEDPAVIGLEDKVPKKLKEGKHLAIIRNPYNLIASRFKMWELTPTYMYVDTLDEQLALDVDLWKRFLKSSIKNTDKHKAFRIVVFDNWFQSKDYRKDIASWLGVEFTTDDGINNVNNTYGSSFDEHDYDGKAQDMQVLNRYKSIECKKLFEPLFEDKELKSLYYKLSKEF